MMTLRFSLAFAAVCAFAQPPFGFPPPPGGFPKGFPGPGGPGGGRGFPGMEERKVLKDYDKDGDKHLNAEERAAARAALAKDARPMRPPRFGREPEEPPKPGPALRPDQVRSYGKEPLYDPNVLRTVFLQFENPDWEKELSDFHGTDVDVPAKVTVDGKTYDGVGVRFRGASSYMMVGEGRKRSLNLSLDYVGKDQRLYGYKTLNLLNSHQDPTFLRAVLYLQAAREYVPAPKANYMRVAINGESWGVYINVEQFNSDFVEEWFPGENGARWKVPGRPGARGGGLSYLGESVAEYKRHYEIKSKDDARSWAALIQFTKVLNETPPEQLEAALKPLLDVDGALKFLALEKVFGNNDGYWTRASDYSIYLDAKGRFHILPHDVNETFAPPERFGPGRGPESGNEPVEEDLSIFAGEKDPNKALLHRLLAVPALRERYPGFVRQIAAKWLDWARLEPLAKRYQALILNDIRTDTRKLESTEAFTKAVAERTQGRGFGPFGGRERESIKEFVERRRAFLLK